MNMSDDAIERLRKYLPTIRNVAGWSAEHLAELLDISRATIVNLENRDKKMSKVQYLAIRALLWEEIETNYNGALNSVVTILVDRDDISEKTKQDLRDHVDQVTKSIGRKVGSTVVAKRLAPEVEKSLRALLKIRSNNISI